MAWFTDCASALTSVGLMEAENNSCPVPSFPSRDTRPALANAIITSYTMYSGPDRCRFEKQSSGLTGMPVLGVDLRTGVVLHLKFFTAGLPDNDWHPALQVDFDGTPHFGAGSIGENLLQFLQQFWVHQFTSISKIGAVRLSLPRPVS
jgi:hypothetical protein